MNAAVADSPPQTVPRVPPSSSATAAFNPSLSPASTPSGAPSGAAAARDARIGPAAVPFDAVLLGTGTVGSAVLRRLVDWSVRGFDGGLRLRAVVDSRGAYVATDGVWRALGRSPAPRPRDADVQACLQRLPAPPPEPDVGRAHAADGAGFDLDAWCDASRTRAAQVPRIVIDATASEAVAERHAHWLAQGVHVVTACKLGQGGPLPRWRAIRDARSVGDTRYGDAATVGAGLPLLRSLRALRDGGDRIHAIAGVLSGSLAWLFHQYDGLRPFSGFVRAARESGYTEPDPREDLCGEDVRRKLLILARAAGIELEPGDVAVASLVPEALAALPADAVDAALPQLDAALRARFAEARRNGECLRFVARLDLPAEGPPQARIGLESLAPDDALAGGGGTDNRVAIYSDRYPTRPLLIQGPGAGAEVTAAALLDDALHIARGTR